MDLVIVGAGFYGLTVANRAAQLGREVLILDKRNHIGGNAHSYIDGDSGIEIHAYGSHLFHTSNSRIWNFVNQFSEFNNYRHRVFTKHNKETYSLPINLHTINQFFGLDLSPGEAKEFIIHSIANSNSLEQNSAESKAISLVGKQLYDAFYKNYTLKQWETDPKLLPSGIVSRLPVRYNYDNSYFDDKWQGLPLIGYSRLFERMIENPKISIKLNTDFFEENSDYSKDKIVGRVPVVYTGAIDRYFDYKLGMLSWRTLDFRIESYECSDFQGTSVMNYSDLEYPFTRIHEFKHLHPERKNIVESEKTVIAKEYSRFATYGDEPYYPVNSRKDRELFKEYENLASDEKDVYFGGRLGSYRYLDMHMAIGAALTFSDHLFESV